MPNKRKTYIRSIGNDDTEDILEFELEFQRTLTTAERFKMMFSVSNKMKEILIRNGYRRPIEIIKRT
ncbi:MAG: hypothetical protein JSV98_10110 [candidate division WOR-3 bacterium]|nr:MAG: hypothetical protein JSV98_10110 [candidate division WOR-3 bacterium]